MLVSLMLQIFMASAFQPVPVTSVGFEDLGEGASCALLRHRAHERKKVLREIAWAKGAEGGRLAADLNFLISNQYFFDKALVADETVLVSLEIDAEGELAKAISSSDLSQIHFSIKGSGIQWRGHPSRFPKDAQWVYSSGTQVLEIKYLIYKADWCFGDDLVEIKWAKDEATREADPHGLAHNGGLTQRGYL